MRFRHRPGGALVATMTACMVGGAVLLSGCGGEGLPTDNFPGDGGTPGQNEVTQVLFSPAQSTNPTIEVGEKLVVTGTPATSGGQTVSGKTVTWTAMDLAILEIAPLTGGQVEITGKQVGTGRVVATTGNIKNTYTVTVVEAGTPPNPPDDGGPTDPGDGGTPPPPPDDGTTNPDGGTTNPGDGGITPDDDTPPPPPPPAPTGG